MRRPRTSYSSRLRDGTRAAALHARKVPLQTVDRAIGMAHGPAFPNRQNRPSCAPELARRAPVATLISSNLGVPVRRIRFRGPVVPRAAMPITAMHKKRDARIAQNHVRRTG